MPTMEVKVNPMEYVDISKRFLSGMSRWMAAVLRNGIEGSSEAHQALASPMLQNLRGLDGLGVMFEVMASALGQVFMLVMTATATNRTPVELLQFMAELTVLGEQFALRETSAFIEHLPVNPNEREKAHEKMRVAAATLSESLQDTRTMIDAVCGVLVKCSAELDKNA